eukprot:scaffold10125_cov34-Tisochrysis_lutea.AAC.1
MLDGMIQSAHKELNARWYDPEHPQPQDIKDHIREQVFTSHRYSTSHAQCTYLAKFARVCGDNNGSVEKRVKVIPNQGESTACWLGIPAARTCRCGGRKSKYPDTPRMRPQHVALAPMRMQEFIARSPSLAYFAERPPVLANIAAPILME